jgi:tetratricopeptide (TPR) repeat protein
MRWTEAALDLTPGLPLQLQAQAWDGAAIAFRLHDPTRAGEFAQRALETYRITGDRDGEAWALRQLGVLAELGGEHERADALYDEAAAIFSELGGMRGLQTVTHDQGTNALGCGDYARARALLEESLARSRALGSAQSVASVGLDLGILARRERRYDDATALFVEGVEGALRHGERIDIALSLRGLAATAVVSGELERAARMIGAAEAIEQLTGDQMIPYERSAFMDVAAPVYDRVTEPAIAAAFAAGRAMSEADAAAYALATAAPAGPRAVAQSLAERDPSG